LPQATAAAASALTQHKERMHRKAKNTICLWFDQEAQRGVGEITNSNR
jgi:hypothetical protein